MAPVTVSCSSSGVHCIEDDDVGTALDLLGDRAPGAQGPVEGGIVDPELRQPPAFDDVAHAHAVQRAHGVGRRVAHLPVGLDQDEAVADPGRVLGGEVLAHEREVPDRHHVGQASVEVPVDAFETAGAAVLERRHPDHDGHGIAAVAHGHAFELGGVGDGGHLAGVAGVGVDRGQPDPDRDGDHRPGPTTSSRPAGPRSPPASPQLSTIWPTRSTRSNVAHVVGRICPSTMSCAPAVPRTGATSSRSENDRSESTPHDPSRRWR